MALTPTPTMTPKSICTLSAGEFVGSDEVEVVLVVDLEDVDDDVEVDEEEPLVVELARTQETPEQVYPAPNIEVQYALGDCTPPHPPTMGVEVVDVEVGAKTQETPLQVYPAPNMEVQ
jgi:hypothetical protein